MRIGRARRGAHRASRSGDLLTEPDEPGAVDEPGALDEPHDEWGFPTGSQRERLELPTGALPLAEHTPPTPEEIGLDLGPPPGTSRRRIAIAVAAGTAIVVVVALVVLRGGDDRVELVSLEPGTCFTPARAVLDVDVEVQACTGSHDAELVAVLSHPAPRGAPFPGADALQLYGEAACRPLVQTRTGETLGALADGSVQLLVALPDADTWDGGERRLPCSLVSDTGALDTGVVTTAP